MSNMAEKDVVHATYTPPDLSDLTCNETLDDEPHLDPGLSPVLAPRVEGQIEGQIVVPQVVTSQRDWALLKDNRVLASFLEVEAAYLPKGQDYFRGHQRGLTPGMRRIVAEWMLQVSQETDRLPAVFSLAVNYFDRFLALSEPVGKGSLQLLGSACLLVASKFRETAPISCEQVIFFTEDSISEEELKVGEGIR